MLYLEVPDYDFVTESNEIVHIKGAKLQLEHSLVSLRKWEQKWHIPFLSDLEKHAKTDEMMLDYIKCMTITQNVNPDVYKILTPENIKAIGEYMENPMTATTFSEGEGPKPKGTKGNNQIVTAEVIYYYMFSYQIPIEAEKWPLQTLITLIRVFNENNKPEDEKKMSKDEIYRQQKAAKAKYNAMAHKKPHARR